MNDYQSAFIGIAVSSFAAAIFVMGYFEQPDTLAVMTNLPDLRPSAPAIIPSF